MKIKLTTIGNTEIEFDSVSEKKAIEELAFWQGLPKECGVCKKPIIFTFRQPQGFTYYGLERAGMPKHEAVFGQHREGGGLFFKGEWKDVQYNSVAAERDAEINNFDSGLTTRINNAIKAIQDLGGKVTPRGGNESEQDYFDSLVSQYNALKQ